MGCDIHCYAERQDELGKWAFVPVHPFGYRDYGLFGWLADVRNYSAVPPIANPRGLPFDVSSHVSEEFGRWGVDSHDLSWLTTQELLAFDYDATFEDRRYTKQISENFFDGGATCEPRLGKITTYREFLGQPFFDDLERLRESGAERIVFWFDS